MAHFTITIAQNIKADIFKGHVRRKTLAPLAFWKRKKEANPVVTGYVAIVNELTGTHEYMMVKATDGTWALPEQEQPLNERINGVWRPIQDNEITLAVKKAISEHENE